MRYLMNQPEFETLLGMQGPEGEAVEAVNSALGPRRNEAVPDFAIVYFTATWCGACRRLDVDRLESVVSEAVWYKCDVDQNNYTPGYCSIRAIPAFVAIRNKKFVGTLQSNDTERVIAWAKGFIAPN